MGRCPQRVRFSTARSGWAAFLKENTPPVTSSSVQPITIIPPLGKNLASSLCGGDRQATPRQVLRYPWMAHVTGGGDKVSEEEDEQSTMKIGFGSVPWMLEEPLEGPFSELKLIPRERKMKLKSAQKMRKHSTTRPYELLLESKYVDSVPEFEEDWDCVFDQDQECGVNLDQEEECGSDPELDPDWNCCQFDPDLDPDWNADYVVSWDEHVVEGLHVVRLYEITEDDPVNGLPVRTRFCKFNMALFDFEKESKASRGPPILELTSRDHIKLAGSVNIVSFKILKSDVDYPISVFGTVLVRDQFDYKCMYLFKRGKDNAQVIHSKKDTLALTDPCRGLAVTNGSYEIQVKVEWTAILDRREKGVLSNSSALEAPDPTVACDDDVRFARTKTCGAVTHAGSLACLLTAAAPERTRMHAHGSPRLQLATCTSNHASVTYVLTAVVAVPCPQRWNWWRVPASQVHYAPSNKRRFGYRIQNR
nr:unnamed protein product [Digitaria exilis]